MAIAMCKGKFFFFQNKWPSWKRESKCLEAFTLCFRKHVFTLHEEQAQDEKMSNIGGLRVPVQRWAPESLAKV